MPEARSYSGARLKPASTTTRTPSMVRDDSAMGVARITRLMPPGSGLQGAAARQGCQPGSG
jgi:hypothetical protein